MELTALTDASGCTTLVVSGEVDMEGSEKLRRTGVTATQTHKGQSLKIDLSAVTFLDSTGLGALIDLRNATHDQSVPLELIDPSGPVLRLLALTRLTDIFSINDATDPPNR
ncbi:MAG: STAS domain-containing protein [Jatrophihabitans sp.]|uniref:STAS domain-containing protein n=1 Tax=Jatrophihabitans sp. TaxID=1932789 RepID=UPI00390E0115